MSKIYRCIDCGKEYKFDYSKVINMDNSNEPLETKIANYTRGLNFPSENNICMDCLKNIKNHTESKGIDKNNLEKITNKYIVDLENKSLNEEIHLKNYTESKEQNKLNELEKIIKKVDQNENELKNLLKELEDLEEKETQFCDECRDLEIKLNYIEKESSKSNNLKLDYENKIKNLAYNNIFSELFQISFNEKFGSINGCKFGDPYNSNNYDSINGGWGYIVLLTKLLTVKYNFQSCKYDLIPEGNFSKILNKDINEEYEIGISDINRTKDKFNRAMEAYLEYLNEFLIYLRDQGKIIITSDDICPKINKNKINDKSIQIDTGKESLENWYLSMKYLLSILKFLICQVLNDENQSYKENISV